MNFYAYLNIGKIIKTKLIRAETEVFVLFRFVRKAGISKFTPKIAVYIIKNHGLENLILVNCFEN